MKNDREEWIGNVIRSAAGLRKLQPSEGLDKRVFQAVENVRGAQLVSMHQFRYSMAAAIALVLLNVGVIAFSGTKKVAKTSSTGPLESYNFDIY